MKLHTYKVTYDHLINGRYRECRPKIVEARNKEEARQMIKDDYYNRLSGWLERGYSTSTAKRHVRWPFHIEAERI